MVSGGELIVSGGLLDIASEGDLVVLESSY
jgi:hypothetical protein